MSPSIPCWVAADVFLVVCWYDTALLAFHASCQPRRVSPVAYTAVNESTSDSSYPLEKL